MKKILFINGFTIGEKSCTGNTFRNIFLNYPKSSLLQFIVDDKNELNSTTNLNTIFAEKEYYPIEKFVRKLIPRKSIKEDSFPSFNDNFKVTFKAAIKECIRGIFDMSFIRFPTNIIKKIDDFDPDVIYTCGPTIRILKITNYFAKRYKVNVIVHYMDDWPEMMYTTSFLSYFARSSILRQLKLVHEHSVQNFAISPFLAEKYSKIYNKPYTDLMNPAKEIVEQPHRRNSNIIRFTYAGSLGSERWENLLVIADILKQLKNEGLNSEFHIYIPPNLNTEKNRRLFMKKGALIFNYVPLENVGQVYADADILVYMESFDERLTKYLTYSLSTKLPEYMGAGKPILCYLPKELLVGNYISENGAGLVSNDRKQLEENIKLLITDANLRYKLSCNGIKCARKNHSMEGNDLKLNRVISKSTNRKNHMDFNSNSLKRKYIVI